MQTTTEQQRAELLGVWELVSFTFETENGTQPWRREVHGTLIYEPSGYMALAINSAVDDDLVYESIFFYSGRFTVAEDTLTHAITNASNPDRIGHHLVRNYRLDGDSLVLSGSDGFGTGEIRWRRKTN